MRAYPRRARTQIPSLLFKISLTAAGLALPPVDFMTWPTNQPSIDGLSFACSTLSGLAAMISSIGLFDGAGVRHLLHAARHRRFSPDRRPRSKRSRTDPWRFCRRWRSTRIRSTMLAICCGGDFAVGDVVAFFVQAAEQLVDHPVGGQLAVALAVFDQAEHGLRNNRHVRVRRPARWRHRPTARNP